MAFSSSRKQDGKLGRWLPVLLFEILVQQRRSAHRCPVHVSLRERRRTKYGNGGFDGLYRRRDRQRAPAPHCTALSAPGHCVLGRRAPTVQIWRRHGCVRQFVVLRFLLAIPGHALLGGNDFGYHRCSERRHVPTQSSDQDYIDCRSVQTAAVYWPGIPWQPDSSGLYHQDSERRNFRPRLFFQDTWKLRPNLTLNYGLGWQAETGAFNSDLPNPAFLAPILGSNNLKPT